MRSADLRPPTCSMCQSSLAHVEVDLPMGSRKPIATPLCWLHYYTSRGVRQLNNVRVLAVAENDNATPNEEVQNLFGEAFLELQQDLAEESARSFQKSKADPLSILNSLSRTSAPKRKKPPKPVRVDPKEGDAGAGGFLKSVPLPARYQKTQQKLQEQKKRDVAVSQTRPSFGNPYQRRKPSRQSIWNMAMDKTKKSIPSEGNVKAAPRVDVVCGCGSLDVVRHGSTASRNSDRKGETWGSKDRSDEVMTRYQCNQCGKTWHEEE
uniref:Uncharacterized protein n=1 Tax=Grammatophora oceanica TaxID=210454 RepID=A0A7S1VUF2_9STRA|mmetsp:Transcript_8097/g.11845  ORF Transcript_8097/g.11845 Transcript_8097/m.11845 type:complete len:265 (+) Transcript_8097:3-797(+)